MWKYYFTSFLLGLSTLSGAYMFLYFKQDLELSFTVINIALAAFLATDVLFELPTGAIGDVIGRKWQAIIGMVIATIGGIGLYFTKTSFHLIISYVVIGLGWAFLTGSREAWLVDKLKANGLKRKVHTYFSHSKVFFLVGTIMGPLIASLLVPLYGARLLFLVDAVIGAMAIFPMLIDYEHFKPVHDSKWLNVARETIAHFYHNRTCRIMFLISLLTSINIGVIAGYQPFLVGLGMPLALLGIKAAAGNVISAASLYLSKFVQAFAKQMLIVTSLLNVVFTVPIFFVGEGQWVIALLLTLLPSFLTIAEPAAFTYQNAEVPSRIRSSALSLFGLASSIGNGVGYLIGGIALDSLGPRISIPVFSFVFIIVAILYAILPSKIGGDFREHLT